MRSARSLGVHMKNCRPASRDRRPCGRWAGARKRACANTAPQALRRRRENRQKMPVCSCVFSRSCRRRQRPRPHGRGPFLEENGVRNRTADHQIEYLRIGTRRIGVGVRLRLQLCIIALCDGIAVHEDATFGHAVDEHIDIIPVPRGCTHRIAIGKENVLLRVYKSRRTPAVERFLCRRLFFTSLSAAPKSADCPSLMRKKLIPSSVILWRAQPKVMHRISS